VSSRRRLAAVPDSPRRGVALIRVSKARGRDDLVSPELQRSSIGDYARAHGIDVVEWVEALDESASRSKSPWWRRLEQAVAQVEARERDVVLVWKVSRAARHRRNWAVALDRIEVAGGTLESATEGLDTTTSTGRLARGMLAELAAWEAEVKGEQWKEAQERRRRLGLPHGGHARFGYTYDRASGYTVDPQTGPLLAKLYERYLAGEGHTTLARWLNRTGVPTVRAARSGWSVQSVVRLLDGGFGAGLIHREDGTWLPGAHEPVITVVQWEAYQRARRARWDVPARVREPAYPLTGLVRCAVEQADGQPCGSSMVAASDARHGPGYMYRCNSRYGGGMCPGVWVTRAQVEARVLRWLAEEVAGDVEARAAGKAARQAAAAEARLERKALSRELVRLEASLKRARGFLIDETLTREEYQTERKRLVERRDELAGRLDQLRVEADWLTGPAVTMARGLVADWDTLPVKRRRDMLAMLIRRVEVRPGVRGAQDVRVVPLTVPG
jgi:site-specific DNA recombinase